MNIKNNNTTTRRISRAAMMLLLMLLTTAAALAETEIVSNIDGTEYTISDANDWNAFCEMLADGETFSGKTVKLGANIEVTRMAGDQDHEFCGTFDARAIRSASTTRPTQTTVPRSDIPTAPPS